MKCELEWAAKQAFRDSVKNANGDDALRKLIESYAAVKKILKYH